jgi:hypothetical protein
MGAGDESEGAAWAAPDPEPGDRGDRRRFLLKAGAAGAAAWVAPVVLSTPAFAAQSGPTPTQPPPACIPCNSHNVVNGSFEEATPGELNDFPGWQEENVILFIQVPYTEGDSFGLVPPPVPHGSSFAGIGGLLTQTIPIDPACVGKPFTLSFWSAFGGTTLAPNGQIAYGFDGLGPPTTVDLAPTVSSTFALQSFTGVVPDGATAFTMSFNGIGLAVDLVDFTICS